MKIGKFELIQEIGQGTFGTVYKANDTTLDRIVAIKALHPHLLIDPRFNFNFQKEAKGIGQIHHPHVTSVFEVNDYDGYLLIVMQYLPGGSLQDQLSKGIIFTHEQAIHVISQISQGLDAGHQAGIIHQDVKPSNILFDQSGKALISDFGMLRVAQQSTMGTFSELGGRLGLPYYRAPELWSGTTGPSPASDIYSLACIYYQMVTGEILFYSDSLEQTLSNVFYELPVLSKDIPGDILSVLIKALSKNPINRYQDIDQFLEAFEGRSERTESKDLSPEENNNVIKPIEPSYSNKAGRKKEIPGGKKFVEKFWIPVLGFLLAGIIFIYLIPHMRKSPPENQSQDTTISFNETQTINSIGNPTELNPSETAIITTAVQTKELVDSQVTHPTNETQETALETPFPELVPTLKAEEIPTVSGPGVRGTVISVNNAKQIRLVGETQTYVSDHLIFRSETIVIPDRLEIIDRNTFQKIKRFQIDKFDSFADRSPDGKILAYYSHNNIKLRDSENGSLISLLRDFDSEIRNLCFVDNENMIVITLDGTITYWDAYDGTQTKYLRPFNDGAYYPVFSHDCRVLTYPNGSDLLIYDLIEDTKVSIQQDHSQNNLIFSYDNSRIMLLSSYEGIFLYNINNGDLITKLEGQVGSGWVEGAFSPNNDTFVTWTDNLIQLWNAQTGELIATLRGNISVRDVIYSPDGYLLASAGNETGIRFWDASTGQLLTTIITDAKLGRRIFFSPDQTQFVTIDRLKIQIWAIP